MCNAAAPDFHTMTRRELTRWIARRHRAILATNLSPARRAQLQAAEAVLKGVA